MTSSLFRRLAVASSLTIGGLALTATSPASAATCTSGVEGDVNGDGYAEVAVSEAGRTFDKGAVHVFYGRPKGLAASASGSALDDQYLDQEQPGVPGTGSNNDDFGTAVAFGDYNDDGCADLAVGAEGDALAGSVYVFYGSKSGLKTSDSVRITNEQILGDPGLPTNQGFGSALAAADLNEDGVTDLAIGDPGKFISEESGERGTVALLFGGSDGLTSEQSTELDRSSADLDGEAGFLARVLTVGDFNGNGIPELAIGIDDGRVQILEGRDEGLTPTMDEPLTGPALGIDDVVQGEDEDPEHRAFGDVLAAGDVDADGDDDLAVGMPRLDSSGVVVLVKGSAQGLTSTGLETWTRGTAGVAGTPRDFDAFGASLAMGRLDTGLTDDLAIGTPFDLIGGEEGAGSVTILLGSPTGLTTAGAGGSRFHQNSDGVPGTAEELDVLGQALTIANVQSHTQGSLVIGAPREQIRGIEATGQFHQLSISTSGPTGSGSVAFNLDSVGVRGDSREGANFGRALD